MSEVNQLEAQRDGNLEHITKRDLALKLANNREFKKLILDMFCVEDCARYAQMSADPALKPEERADALALAQAAGHLRRYLSVTVRMGNQAEAQNLQIDEELAAMRAEQAAEAEADSIEPRDGDLQ